MLKKFFFLVGILAITSNMFIGCSKQDNLENTQESIYKNGDKVTEELSKDVLLDAKLAIPNYKQCYVIQSKCVMLDKKYIKSVLSDYDVKSPKNIVLFSEFNDKGFYLTNKEESVIFNGQYNSVAYSNNSTCWFPKYLQIDIKMMDQNNNIIESAINRFTKNSIEGISQEEAQKKADALMKSINLSSYYDPIPKIVVMDKNTINNIEIETQLDNANAISDEEQGYLFLYYRTLYGLPVCNETCSGAVSLASEPGCLAQISIQKNGGYSMNAAGIYDCISKEEVSIISVDKVLEMLRKKYSELLEILPIKITSISLEYLPRQIETGEPNYEIRPVWMIRTEEAIKGLENRTMIKRYAIDAVTEQWLF